MNLFILYIYNFKGVCVELDLYGLAICAIMSSGKMIIIMMINWICDTIYDGNEYDMIMVMMALKVDDDDDDDDDDYVYFYFR